jgi:hypothetical protein
VLQSPEGDDRSLPPEPRGSHMALPRPFTYCAWSFAKLPSYGESRYYGDFPGERSFPSREPLPTFPPKSPAPLSSGEGSPQRPSVSGGIDAPPAQGETATAADSQNPPAPADRPRPSQTRAYHWPTARVR